jgi:DNA polymerase-1
MLKHCLTSRCNKAHSYRLYADRGNGPIEFDKLNLQNIPIRTERGQKIRKHLFRDENYTIISADYSQIELRIIPGVENMIKAF